MPSCTKIYFYCRIIFIGVALMFNETKTHEITVDVVIFDYKK